MNESEPTRQEEYTQREDRAFVEEVNNPFEDDRARPYEEPETIAIEREPSQPRNITTGFERVNPTERKER